jgi:RNase P subunit RPR2
MEDKRSNPTVEGQPCKHCGEPVVRRSHNRPRKRSSIYWYRSWLVCLACGAYYMLESEKVFTKDDPGVFGASPPNGPKREKKQKKKKGQSLAKTRWVYVFDTGIRNGDRGTFKIGISVNIDEREKALKAGNPLGKMLFAGLVDFAMKFEKQLHDIYKKYSVERELFSFTKPDLFIIRDQLRNAATDWYAYRGNNARQ